MNADSQPCLPEEEQATAEDAELAQALDGYLAALEAGQAPSPERLLAEHPGIASRLRACLAGLQVIENAAGSFGGAGTGGATGKEPECLGDFRIVREVGRGGMGIVYEAEQRSLGRRVALKVLPLAATLDERHLRRFKNEALAAAHLDHSNIVDVLGVGSERGVHYYAMRFIEGRTLADIIHDLRARRDRGKGTPADPDAALTSAPTRATGSLSTWDSLRGPAFFRSAAELGAQVAEALDHAHQQGIIHRDIKPANLLLDKGGKPWVTDFGLAKMHSDVKLTQTGDLVGTLRYMSPEQALARRGVIDPRSDIYSLGATLYELLALEPLFAGQDRQELLRQIAFEEPRPPRRLNSTIPPELETIVLKAIEKEPQDRYATAQELAEDLRRYLEDRPILARRPSWRQVAIKWARRHKPVVWAAAVVFLLTAMLGSGTWVWLWQKQVAAEQEVERVLEDAVGFQKQGKKAEALAAAERAFSLLPGATINQDLQRRVRQRLADLKMDARLEEIRLLRSEMKEGDFDLNLSVTAYEQAFREYGIDVAALSQAEAVERIQKTSIGAELAAALVEWAGAQALIRGWNDPTRNQLLALAHAANPEDWGNQVRAALYQDDPEVLKELAASKQTADLPPSTLVPLGIALRRRGASQQALALIRQAQRNYPGDFWVNYELGYQLREVGPAHGDEAIRFFTAALALRPGSATVHNSLGVALGDRGRFEEAIAEYQEAIRLKKDYANAYNNLGVALWARGRQEEAIEKYQEALRLQMDLADAHNNLGNALRARGRLQEAIAEFEEAIRLKPNFAKAHSNLGIALWARGRQEEAIARFQLAIRLKPDFAEPHNNLGYALMLKGRIDEAIAKYRDAIQQRPDYANAHHNLANALKARGRLDEAITEYRTAAGLGLKQAAADLRACERQLALRRRLPGLIAGQDRPTDQAERLEIASLCQQPFERRYALAVRFYAEAFTTEPKLPDNLNSGQRYNAACAAALAGCGQGEDSVRLAAEERGRLRQQALDWLRADLAAWHKVLAENRSKAGPAAQKQMQHWLQDSDLAGVRGPEALARLPEEERQAWQKLWTEVEELFIRAGEKGSGSEK